ncbi:MAG TPA: response regulator transcription factor [Solirubrobacteraceae bacterium]|jgi:DNA-binding NarL/FixJ family response regulator|nr:response regulator transcription factor [Solirubrobacteraceae bacterium]
MSAIRVLIVDDQRIVRDGLEMLVGLIDGVEVVGVASDGRVAVDRALAERPDVVLMDLRMPNLDGIEATALLADRLPATRVVILTTYADDASIIPALKAGARGYLTKDAGADEIESAIRNVHAGATHLDAAVQQQMLAALHSPGPPAGVPAPADEHGLTARELEVLGLIASGYSNVEIADRLVVSMATVKTHVNRVFAKAGVRDRAQAVIFAHRNGLDTRVTDRNPEGIDR